MGDGTEGLDLRFNTVESIVDFLAAAFAFAPGFNFKDFLKSHRHPEKVECGFNFMCITVGELVVFRLDTKFNLKQILRHFGHEQCDYLIYKFWIIIGKSVDFR